VKRCKYYSCCYNTYTLFTWDKHFMELLGCFKFIQPATGWIRRMSACLLLHKLEQSIMEGVAGVTVQLAGFKVSQCYGLCGNVS